MDPAGRAGLFTTLRVVRGRPWLWERHAERLVTGARALRLPVPDVPALRREVERACQGLADARARILVRHDAPPRVEAREHRDPAGPWTLVTVRLEPDAALASWKTDRRAVYDRARAIAGAAGEALLLDARGRWLECSIANVFLLVGRTLWTPPATRPLLPGLGRAELFARAPAAGLRVVEGELDSRLASIADGCLVTNALLGAWPVCSVAGLRAFPPSGRVARIRAVLAPVAPTLV